MIKPLARYIFRKVGYEIKRTTPISVDRSYNLKMQEGLERVRNIGLQFSTVCDIGAAEGGWSLLAKRYWPNAIFVLFEPLKEREATLRELAKINPTFHIVTSAAGSAEGSIDFGVSEDLDGSGVAAGKGHPNIRTVKVTTVEAELKKLEASGPIAVKLDTHGFEVPILEGLGSALPSVELFIVECYGFQIAPQSLLFWEMCQRMDVLGYRLFDIVDVMHRKKDGVFWQCDAFFIRKEHAVFQDNRYS